MVQLTVVAPSDVNLISSRTQQSTQQPALTGRCKGHDQLERMYSTDKQEGSETSYICELGDNGLQHPQHAHIHLLQPVSAWLSALTLALLQGGLSDAHLDPSSVFDGASQWSTQRFFKTMASRHISYYWYDGLVSRSPWKAIRGSQSCRQSNGAWAGAWCNCCLEKSSHDIVLWQCQAAPLAIDGCPPLLNRLRRSITS